MSSLMAIGNATLDIINTVAEYPKEDSKVRIVSSRKCRGGNATNALVISAQLGIHGIWLGSCRDPESDSDAQFILQDLKRFNIDTSLCEFLRSGDLPTSYITQSQASGSRTIQHMRNLKELDSSFFIQAMQSVSVADTWFHFECRNLNQLQLMMESIPSEALGVSLEIESTRHDWEIVQKLIRFAKIVFVSKAFVNHLGFETARDFLNSVEFTALVICPWGEQGAYYRAIGAGDTFIGSFLAAVLQKIPIPKAIAFACEMARFKCSVLGLHLPIDQVKEICRSYDINPASYNDFELLTL